MRRDSGHGECGQANTVPGMIHQLEAALSWADMPDFVVKVRRVVHEMCRSSTNGRFFNNGLSRRVFLLILREWMDE